MDSPSDLAATLEAVTGALPGGGEERPGQLAMAEAVARAVDEERHLVIQAGTGTGKSLAYLLPLVRSGRRVVVATATKALQDQLATKELPFLAGQLGDDHPFSFSVLKGRSNYLCRQRAAEIEGTVPDPDGPPLEPASLPGFDDTPPPPAPVRPVPETGPGSFGTQVRDLLAWGVTSRTGDRAELPFEPHPRAWAAVSVGSRECPGAFRCDSGPVCFAELARGRAAAADVVVVNTHLYASHVASGRSVLPEHDVLVLDEAHEVEDVMTEGLGLELTGGRLRALAGLARGIIAEGDSPTADGVLETADLLEAALRPLNGNRVLLDGRDPDLRHVLTLARGRTLALSGALRRVAPDPETDSRRTRALLAADHLTDDLARLDGVDRDQVAWVESSSGRTTSPALRVAPVEIGPVLASALWPEVTAVLTSATIPPGIETRLGLPSGETDRLEVGSPFPYRDQALLYVPTTMPDRRSPEAEVAIHLEIERLALAAGGRTLALFTSRRAMETAVTALRPLLPFQVWAQDDLPKAKLLEAFAEEESSCLFATMSFWQGVDVPGRTLSLVVLDRLPFPRPDDPLLQARRDRAGPGAFSAVDLPRAATLLAQGAGRLIRNSTDRGVVAVLDPRLATASYRRTLLAGVPPMRRTTDPEEVAAFLEAIAAGA